MSRKIADMIAITDTEVADNDLIIVEDVSATQTKKMEVQYLNPSFKVSTQTGNYTITRDHEVVFASGDIAITLAAASNAFHSKIINIGTGDVTYAAAAGDTIEGDASRILTNQFEAVELIGNGANLHGEF